MKTIMTLCLLFIISTSVAQENKEEKLKPGNYIFTSPFQTNEETDFNGKVLNNTSTLHKIGNIINLISIKGDSVILQYYRSKKFSDTTKKIKETTFNTTYYKSGNVLKYYKIKIDDFKKVTSPYYPRYKGASAGIYSVPFKLRFNNFDFEQNLNIGINIGLQYRINKKINDRWILEPNFGIGLAKVNLNSKNSNVTESRTASAFSVSTGLILHLSKTINAGCFIGWDFLSNSDANTNWVHNKKTWLGLGINIGFNISDSKATTKENNNSKN
ncbi:hypothetical protein [Tenacibaculum aiptasiae]|uniref:hypothetical protein n=1 Tax=Tenacibaculum aiptasiae TaxID=426481 RepID=UPI0023304F1C|nr:hypothetical protein [Tenacibaculum aiptasiae]